MSVKPIFHCDAKTFSLGRRVGQYPQRESFALGIPTCWYLRKLKFVLPPTQTPNASQWNIVCVGCPGVGSRVGHVHLIFFVSISFALGSQFQVEYGLYNVTSLDREK